MIRMGSVVIFVINDSSLIADMCVRPVVIGRSAELLLHAQKHKHHLQAEHREAQGMKTGQTLFSMGWG